MASEDVAAGDGAFLTWSILLPMSPVPLSKIKSSTRLPFWSRACALTPEGPLKITKLNVNSKDSFLKKKIG